MCNLQIASSVPNGVEAARGLFARPTCAFRLASRVSAGLPSRLWALFTLLSVPGHPLLLQRGLIAVGMRVQRGDVAILHRVVANPSLQSPDDRVPVGPEGAARVPLERARLRILVDLDRVSHVVVVEVGPARDDLIKVRVRVRVVWIGSGLAVRNLGVRMRGVTSLLCATRCTHRFSLVFTS